MRRLLVLAILLLLVSLLAAPFRGDFGGEIGRLAWNAPRALAADACEQPVNRFRGGPGRRPGSTAVYVSIHEQIQNEQGQYVYASSDETVAEVEGGSIPVRVILQNHSLYTVGNAVVRLSYRAPVSGEKAPLIEGVIGAAYDPARDQFLVTSIPAGEDAIISFRMEFPRSIGSGLYQHKAELLDFVVLDTERLFPTRTPEDAVSRSRSTIEHMGIGGTDVVCFSSGTSLLIPGRMVEAVLLDDSEDTEDAALSVLVQMSVSSSEVRPGMLLRYTITVINNGKANLAGVVVDDRFSQEQFSIEDSGGGYFLDSGIQWYIENLRSGDRWFTAFSLRVADTVSPGDILSSTVRIIAEDLIGSPTAPRSDSVQVTVIGGLPATGSALNASVLAEWGMALLAALLILSAGTCILFRRTSLTLSNSGAYMTSFSLPPEVMFNGTSCDSRKHTVRERD